MKKRIRALSMLLACLFLFPLGTFASFAEQTEYGSQDFEKLTADEALSGADGFAELPTYATVLEAEGNRFVRIPFVGDYVSAKNSSTGSESMEGNCYTALRVNHAALNGGDGFTIELDYRPHYNGVANAMVEVAFRQYTFTMANGTVRTDEGTDMILFRINLNNGSLQGAGTALYGVDGMKLDAWNRVKVTFHPENGRYEVYVNGTLYSRQEAPKMAVGTTKYANCKDVKINESELIIARCGKNEGGYTATDLGDATNYVDVDNFRIYQSREAKVTLDGKETIVNLDVGIDLKKNGKKLLYAEVTYPNKAPFYTADVNFEVVDGMVINTRYVGLDPVKNAHVVRTNGEVGLRFLTSLSKADFTAIKEDAKIKDVRIGTVILPEDLIVGDTLTAESLESVEHLDIPATDGAWYDYRVTYCHVFAGSIVKIKEENSNRSFVGSGYVRVTMQDGTTLTVFAEGRKEHAAKKVMSFAAYEEMRDNTGLSAGIRLELEKYAGVAALELKGLNVLAMGDSLFQGAQNENGFNQWINVLGRRYGWNLTNLGIGGATISYQPEKDIANVSMYNLLFHTDNYKYGSRTDSRYYNCGSPSGVKADVDLILLQAGSNDYGPKVQAPLGTVGSTDHREFLGAWKLMVDRLLVEYPNATIIMMTAWENGNQQREDNANAIEYTSSVVDLYEALYAENTRVTLIDSGDPEVSGVDMRNSAFKEKYAFDSFHLNNAGMNLMADSMLPLLQKVVLEREEMQIAAQNDLNVLAIGDSLFGGHSLADGEQWLEILAARCSWNLTNLGANGWTVAKNDAAYPEGATVRASMYDKLMNNSNFKFGTTAMGYTYGDTKNKSAADVDVVFLEGGWNDYGWNLPLGTVNDTDGSTYMGAVNAMVECLLETYANAKVVLITSWHTEGVRADGANRMDFVANGMKEIYSTHYADNDRVALIDAGDPKVSGIHMTDSAWSAQYAMDAAHLNAEGMKVMADSMQALIWKYVLDK